ncbi:uncharacterized protein LOC134255204 [Saccostrea cucullata]|uniref:uncharacterized protein LOC134255204 n=1 Tax=Saccostrea cuccullata TaxID=36930 RepID=UPI002ED1826A
MITTHGDSLASVLISCIYKCNGYRRCIGLEICKVQDNLFQCRACCAWKIIGTENSNENVTNCRYLRTVEKQSTNNFESRPWIKIDLQSTFDVDKVLVFNRQDYGGFDR